MHKIDSIVVGLCTTTKNGKRIIAFEAQSQWLNIFHTPKSIYKSSGVRTKDCFEIFLIFFHHELERIHHENEELWGTIILRQALRNIFVMPQKFPRKADRKLLISNSSSQTSPSFPSILASPILCALFRKSLNHFGQCSEINEHELMIKL